MNHKSTFSIYRIFRSISFAVRGLTYMFKNERNARIHFTIAIISIILCIILDLNIYEWLFILSAIALVIAAELFNTAIEKLCNHITKERNNDIKIIKDLSAAGVLICALYALIAGLLIFIPRIWELFS
ncbi:MAG: diacylglycerol kinase [Bacteroidales bacterium]